jgi:hypothetical protein
MVEYISQWSLIEAKRHSKEQFSAGGAQNPRRISMLKFCKTLVVFLALSAGMLPTAHAAAQFAAGLVVLPKGARPSTGEIFVKGAKVRQEISGPNGTQIMIFRSDLKVTWMMTEPEKTWLQMAYLPSDNEFEEWRWQKFTNARFLGNDTIRGINCRKYQAVEDGKTTVYWVSEKLSLPVRIENQYETIEFINVRKCRLSDSLFEIPASYKKAITTIEPPQE